MLGDIENSIKDRFDWKARGPAMYDDEEAQRKSIFTYDRPIIEHFGLVDLELPESLDTGISDNIYLSSDCAADGWRKYAASDVSDDGEGDPADVWISPDTFALWSRGTKRWDEPSDKYRSIWEGQQTYEIPVSEGWTRSRQPHQRLNVINVVIDMLNTQDNRTNVNGLALLTQPYHDRQSTARRRACTIWRMAKN